jgi:hypothetical protein
VTRPTDPQVAASTVWQRQSVWSQAANRAKRRIDRSRSWVLALTVAAAVLGTASAQLAGRFPGVGKVLAVAAAAGLGLAPFFAKGAGRDAVQAWIRMRSVSESLKADVYRYLAAANPFHGADRDAVLLARLDERMVDAGDLVTHTADIDPVPRNLPPVTDAASYLTHRLDAQRNSYYLPAGRRMAKRASMVRRVTTVLAGAAAVLTATAGVLGASRITAWVGVVTTVTTALTGYAAAQRYEYQQLEYVRTAGQLERLRTGRLSGQSYTDDDAFIAESERIISISNEGWMAKVAEENPA